MLRDYTPLLVLGLLAGGFVAATLVLSELVGRRRRNVGKGEAYECGMDPRGNARLRLSIHFYLVAVLFILFDVEGLFLVLWASSARELTGLGAGAFVLAEIGFFVALLVLALAYVWRKGGLEWDR
jgi:NADH-quinone oxidoreductase subunit A